jgi:hypothetical protein
VLRQRRAAGLGRFPVLGEHPTRSPLASASHTPSVLLERDEGLVLQMIEADVERPQIGMQAGVRDRDQVGHSLSRAPEARRRDESRSRLAFPPCPSRLSHGTGTTVPPATLARRENDEGFHQHSSQDFVGASAGAVRARLIGKTVVMDLARRWCPMFPRSRHPCAGLIARGTIAAAVVARADATPRDLSGLSRVLDPAPEFEGSLGLARNRLTITAPGTPIGPASRGRRGLERTDLC